MDRVTQTDWNHINDIIQGYRDAMAETEEEKKEEIERVKTDSDEENERVRKAHKQDLLNLEEDHGETVDDVKKTANDYVENVREQAKSEVKELERQLYDRSGRVYQDVRLAEQTLKENQAASEIEQEKSAERQRETEKYYDDRISEIEKRHIGEMEEAVRLARDHNLTSSSLEHEDRNAASRAQRKQTEERYQSLVDENNRRTKAAIDEAKATVKAAEKAYRSTKARDDEVTDTRLQRLIQSYEQRSRDEIATARRQFDKEGQRLREDLKKLTLEGGEYHKGRAEGRQETIRDMEQQQRTREQIMQQTYQDMVQNERRLAEEHADYLNQRANAAIGDKEQHFAGTIQRMNRESHAEKQMLKRTFEKNKKQIESQIAVEREASARAIEDNWKAAQKQNQVAMEAQAKAANETLTRQKQDQQTKMKHLEEELQTFKTTDNAQLISPAAEDSVRKSVVKQYDKLLNAEVKQHQREEDYLRRELTQELRDTQADLSKEIRNVKRRNAIERDVARAGFVNHIMDVEMQKQDKIQTLEESSQDAITKQERMYIQLLKDQKRKFEELLDSTRMDAENRIRTVNQAANFREMLAHRAATELHNRSSRDHEARLLTQKEDYELQIKLQREKFEKQVRDLERDRRLQLGDQERVFSQRMEQALAQNTQREDRIIEGYGRQLENLRRANARLIQKTS